MNILSIKEIIYCLIETVELPVIGLQKWKLFKNGCHKSTRYSGLIKPNLAINGNTTEPENQARVICGTDLYQSLKSDDIFILFLKILFQISYSWFSFFFLIFNNFFENKIKYNNASSLFSFSMQVSKKIKITFMLSFLNNASFLVLRMFLAVFYVPFFCLLRQILDG